MTVSDWVLLGAFVAGALPANALVVRYWFWTPDWRGTSTGWVLMSLFIVTAISFNLSVLVLLFPDTFKDGGLGLTLRLLIRWSIAAVLWALLVLLLRAQRRPSVPLVPGPAAGPPTTDPRG